MSASVIPRRRRLGAYYWPSARRAISLVQRVGVSWPAPARLVAQVLLAIAALVVVPVIWIYKTLVAVLRIIGGLASQGESPSGPPRGPDGYA